MSKYSDPAFMFYHTDRNGQSYYKIGNGDAILFDHADFVKWAFDQGITDHNIPKDELFALVKRYAIEKETA